jgi:predicted O-linked N-acetylglucosamine transferase (SPINDLY family)
MMKCVAGADPGCRDYQLGRFARRGIDPARVNLVGFIGAATEHLAMYRQVDVALDTFPYHGTTTTLDSLLMGVPVVTLAGYNHASRVGESLLTQVGLPDLIARNPDDYVAKAVALARDPARIGTLHGTLRQSLLASSLCDGPRFTRKFEFALRGMWLNWCRSRGITLSPAEQAQAAFDFSALPGVAGPPHGG